MIVRYFSRWVLATDVFLLGKYYWPDATADELTIRTFRTREQARQARKECGLKNVRVLKATVRIKVEA